MFFDKLNSCWTELFEIELIIYIKMDLTLKKPTKVDMPPNQTKICIYTELN